MKKRTLLSFLALTLTVPLLFACKKTDHTSNPLITEVPTPTVTMQATQSKEFITDYLLTIDSMTGYDISELLYGLFLEDINYAVDGGLYAEMVKNRSFEYGSMAKGENLHGWSADQDLEYRVTDGSLDHSYLNQNNTHYLSIRNTTESELSIKNSGFLDGMTIEEGANYEFSGYFRSKEGISSLQILLIDESGNLYASASIPEITKEFRKYEVTLTALASAPSSFGVSLYVVFGKGQMDADMLSLFPQDTYKGRKNGLRKDLSLALEELSPAFLRFPGGCVVEGETLENSYNWKNSIGNGIPFEINGSVTYGDVATRPLSENLWGDQNSSSNHPYYMTYGLGFYEYFLLCEDLGSEPVPIVNAGLSCLIQGARKVGTPADALPIDSEEFYQYIQDALDLVEFCKGDETTTWGAIRIAMGHKEPFPLNYIGIGNEQWGTIYFERYEQFVKAFEKAALEKPELYKDIQLIVANGPVASDTYAWKKIKLYGTEYAGLVDEHYYMAPSWFLSNTKRYDSYDRNSVPVFLGEYAAKSNNLEAALAEAAFMTGIERNGDIVKLASYAPLFGNSISYQWTPDLIWFKSGVVWKSVNYYVQQLFSTNVAKQVIPSTLIGNQSKLTNESFYQVCGIDENQDIILKLVNTSDKSTDITIRIPELKETKAFVTTLSSESLTDMNTVVNPKLIVPVDASIIASEEFVYQIPKYCVAILRIPTK